MTRIGLLSDTHGYLDESVFTHFDRCDEIWHAGDFGHIAVADTFAAFKPLTGVYGNIDGPVIRSAYPAHSRFACEPVDVWMTHIGGYPGRYSTRVKSAIQKAPTTLFFCGHYHCI